MNVNQLFPTPVADFSIGRDFTSAELKYILSTAERRPNGYNETSCNGYILERPELSEIKKFILQSVEEYTTKVWRIQPECRFKLTQSWANYTKPGQSHMRHIHANSIYSGVLYISTDSMRDKIHFYRHDPSTIRPNYVDQNIFNAASWWLPAETGTMILFPSVLEHAVTQVGEGIERCSLAFNVFPQGLLGDMDALTELSI